MAEYRLSPAAQRDLDEIFDFTVTNWGVEQAVRYTARMRDTCSALAHHTIPSYDCSYLRAGYRRCAVERHFIYFRLTEYGIAVIRILHQRMDAPGRL